MVENENVGSEPDVEAVDVAEQGEAAGQGDAERSWLITLSREFGRTFRRGKDGIDLLVEASESAFGTATTVTKRIAKFPRRIRQLSPGDEALFEELGAKCAECPADDYLALKNDLEFWELIRKLHSIRGKVAKVTAAQEECRQEAETADSSPEDAPSDEEIPEVAPDEPNEPDKPESIATDEESSSVEPPTDG